MKKTTKQKWLTALLMLGALWAGAQNFKCGTTMGPGNPNPPPSGCGNILNCFAPTTTSTIDTINVNMVFFKPSVGAGLYDTITISTPQKLIDLINGIYSNLSAPHLINNPPAALISDSKIRFRLKSFSKITSDSGYIFVAYNTPSSKKAHLIPFIDSNAVNVFWSYDTASVGCGGGGFSWNIPHHNISMGLCGVDFPINYSEGVAHELGHALGLPHTDVNTYNETVWVNDYVVENSTIFGVPGPCAITPPTVSLPYSNNIMAYNWQCRKYLSPQQIGLIKYYFKSQFFTKRFLKNNNQYASCTVDHLNDLNITSSQTWNTARVFYGDLIVKTGNILTINCEVSFGSGAKLIIEKGAKVILNSSGKLYSHCRELWGGVEVEGDQNASQIVDNLTNLSAQGILEVNGGKIQDAYIGVALYKRDASNNLINGSTGGLVFCRNGKFIDNYIGAEFMPYDYWYRDPLLNYNFSYFKNTRFTLNKSQYTFLTYPSDLLKYKSNVNPAYAISLNGVKSVEIAGCYFNDYDFQSLIHVNGIDASVKVQGFCPSISGSNCTTALIKNEFYGGKYGIYLSNPTVFLPSIIDSAIFGQNNTINSQEISCIYINNSFGSQITNNTCIIISNNVGKKRTGIYIDNSNGYVVEGNKLNGLPASLRTNSSGIIINNSGPYANSVYNNTFLNLDQGLWAQNQNVDLTSGVGLKMNCNDFTSCKYNIGVQKSGRSLLNNTGVDNTQGIAGGPDIDNVRNTYSIPTTASCINENKFYVNTSNSFSTSHGSFLGAQFHPTPQPACSNGSELIDVIGVAPSGGKSTYCPSTISSSFSSRMVQNKIIELQSELQKLDTENYAVTNNTQALRTNSEGGKTKSGNTLNNNQMTQAKLNLKKTELGLMVNEKIRRFLNDTTSFATDSILKILDDFDLNNKQILRVSLNLSAKRYATANNQINQNKNNTVLKEYCDLQKMMLDYYAILPNQRKTFVQQNNIQLLKWAGSYDMFLEGAAKGLLASASMPVTEEKLSPETENNMRLFEMAAISEQINGSLKIYPNPASNKIIIELENNNSNLIELRDIMGKLLLTQIIEFKGQLDLNNLENGIYFVNLVNDKEKAVVHSSKIIVIK